MEESVRVYSCLVLDVVVESDVVVVRVCGVFWGVVRVAVLVAVVMIEVDVDVF